MDESARTVEVEPLRGSSRDGRLVRDSIIYATGGLAGKVAAVILLPFLTRLLSPSEYGRLDVVSATGTAITVILVLGLDVAATRLYFEWDEAPRRRGLIASWLTLTVLVGAIAAGLLFLGARGLSGWLIGDDSSVWAFALLAIIVPAGLLNALGLNVLRIQNRPVAYALISGSTFLMNALLALAAAGPLRWGVTGVVGAWAVSVSLGAFVGLLATRSLLGWSLDASVATALARLGLPLVPATGVTWLTEVANRGLLVGAGGTEAVGQLSVALRVASIVGLAGSAFYLAWQPRTFASADSMSRLATRAREALLFTAGCSLLVVALPALAPELVPLVAGQRFEGAAALVGPVSLGALFLAVANIAGTRSMLVHRSADVGSALAIGAACSLALNVLLVQRLGAAGTALAIAGGQAIGLLVIGRLASGRGRVNVRMSLFVVSLLVAVIAGVLLSVSAPELPGRLAIVVGSAGVIGTITMWWGGPRRRGEATQSGSASLDSPG